MAFQPNSPAARDAAFFMHPYTNARAHEKNGPMIIERGEGVYVYDDGGKQYLEAMAGLWSASLGFGENRLVTAATAQMEKLPYYHTFAHKAHLPGIDLAEKLIQKAPVPMSKIFFASSGSEGVRHRDQADMVLQQRRGRRQEKDDQPCEGLSRGYDRVRIADRHAGEPSGLRLHPGFTTPRTHTTTALVPPASEEDFATRSELEAMILEEGPDTVAAFSEPIQGAGGVNVPPKTWERSRRSSRSTTSSCRRRGHLRLWTDRELLGLSDVRHEAGPARLRQGAVIELSADSGRHDLGPRLPPIADQSQDLGVLGHGYTYGPPGLCSSRVGNAEDLRGAGYRRSRPLGRTALPEGCTLLEIIRWSARRGRGLMGALEIVADKDTKEPFDPKLTAGAHAYQAAEHGLIVRASATCRVHTAADPDREPSGQAFDKMKLALDDTLAALKKAKAAKGGGH